MAKTNGSPVRFVFLVVLIGLSLSLLAARHPPDPDDLIPFAVHWMKTGVSIGSETRNFEVLDLLCLLAGGCGGDPNRIPLFDNVRISSKEEEENRRNAYTDFQAPSASCRSATLVVDLDSTCYPFEEWTAPPPGHNFPADCDAYDRVFEFTLDEDISDPEIEVVRAITPFGGPMHFEADVTHHLNSLTGNHIMKVFISTWSDPNGIVSGADGGWNVTAWIDFERGPAPKSVLAVVPLFKHSYKPDSGQPTASFSVPTGTTDAFIEYRVTGHGAGSDTASGECIGPAEEFCERLHTAFVDGNRIDEFRPWREEGGACTLTDYGDTAQFCLENPTGNPASVTAPRSNWAPGSVTPPIILTSDALLVPGEHTFAYQIDNVVSGGSWRVSAVYYALGESP